jgi:hypothetical protein
MIVPIIKYMIVKIQIFFLLLVANLSTHWTYFQIRHSKETFTARKRGRQYTSQEKYYQGRKKKLDRSWDRNSN